MMRHPPTFVVERQASREYVKLREPNSQRKQKSEEMETAVEGKKCKKEDRHILSHSVSRPGDPVYPVPVERLERLYFSEKRDSQDRDTLFFRSIPPQRLPYRRQFSRRDIPAKHARHLFTIRNEEHRDKPAYLQKRREPA